MSVTQALPATPAWWLLDEPVTLPMLMAGALVLGSVAISLRARR